MNVLLISSDTPVASRIISAGRAMDRFRFRRVDTNNLTADEISSADVVFVSSPADYDALLSEYGSLLVLRYTVLVSEIAEVRSAMSLIRSGIYDIIEPGDLPGELASLCERIREDKMVRTGFFTPGSFSMLREERCYILRNDIRIVPDLVSVLMDTVKSSVPGHTQIEIALYESVYNAIEHGNLGITFTMKRTLVEEERYADFMQQRAHEKPYVTRRVRVKYTITPQNVRFRVRDDGDGFDWRSEYDRIANEELYRGVNGRGMKIMTTAFDRVIYNKKGNEVCLVKKLDTGQSRRRK